MKNDIILSAEKYLLNLREEKYNPEIHELNKGYVVDAMRYYATYCAEKAFDAGAAWATGSHKDFKQIHPNKKEFIKP